MDLSEYHYDLPQELIAQQPLAERDASRMLVLDRKSGSWQDRHFRDLAEFLRPGDCLALNNSRVFPSRLFGHREGHTGRVQIFLLRPANGDARHWEALVRPGRKLPVGSRIEIAPSFVCEITGRGSYGERTVRLDVEGDVWEALDRIGHTPLPLYIHRPDDSSDRERYQTVYAQTRGSVAAPTAGLHFTTAVLDKCRTAGAGIAYLTLHVGLGTFQPLHEEQIASQE
ncbi:MAG: S-adenosylmethionine:tRNA ribosyltransferase-isomerase, partial [Bryobacteraceae bacterium]|nr:S-adenosylmethionine:tRNA ribosyltransferase-isomerase [Bryobacteraceae bacterium]